MSNARDSITAALTKTRRWYTQKELMQSLKVNTSDCSVLLRELIANDIAQVMIPPPGHAPHTQRIYAADGVPALDGARPLPVLVKRSLRRLRTKVTGFRAAARSERKKKRLAKKSAHKHKPAPSDGDLVLLTDKGCNAIADCHSPRWALTSDGSFLLLDTGMEITKPAARSLVQFVRTLDAGAA